MNKIFQLKSIKTRLTLWFLLASLIPLILFAVVIYNQRVKVIEQRSFEKLSAIRDLKVIQIQAWIGERTSDILTASQDQTTRKTAEALLQNTFSSQEADLKALTYEKMSRLVTNYHDYIEVFILDTSGIIRISTDRNSEGTDESNNDYFTHPLENRAGYIKNIFISKKNNAPAMTFSCPIFHLEKKETVTGVLVARIDLENSLYDLLLSHVGMGQTGETLIVNSDGYALNELRYYERAPLNLIISAEPAKEAALGNTGIIESKDYIGNKVLAAYTFIPEAQWGFVAKQDYEELNAPISKMLRDFSILIVISIFLVYAASLVLGQLFSRPIVSITETAKRISEGNLDAKSGIESKDEIGFLSRTINILAENLSSQMTITKGTLSINKKLIAVTELIPFSKVILEDILDKTQSNMGAIYRLSEDGKQIDPLFSIGVNTELLTHFDPEKFEGEFGITLLKQKISYLKNIPPDTPFRLKTFTGEISPREIVTIPLVVTDKTAFFISLASIEPFPPETLQILELTQISLTNAFSNILSIEKLKNLTADLQTQTEELECQKEELQLTSEELQEQNIEIDLQRIQVEEANRLKSQFLSNMSHELRTPLNSVMALSRVLSLQTKEKLSPDEQHYLDIIERNGRQLLNLINDILDLSKIESGQLEIRLSVFSMRTVIKTILEQVKPLAEEKNIKLFFEAQENLPQIQSDEANAHLIFRNIISNAIKFTPKGKVSVSITYDKNNVFIDIQDTGIGIPEEELSFIFQEFRQIDGTLSKKYEGTGLGLAIAQRTTNLMGGEITVQSTLGKGSTFSVVLPLIFTPSNNKIEIIQDSSPPSLEFQGKGPLADIKNSTLLIIEDNPIARVQIKTLLENEGFSVELAKDGIEGLEYLQHSVPDGIILDLMMPEMDGFEVLEKIRNNKVTAKIPVLILSAKSLTTEEKKRLKFNNIRQMIRKGDINREDLLAGIYSMLGYGLNNFPEKVISSKTGTTEKISGKERGKGNPVILVIEDNPDNLDTLRAVLGNSYTVVAANDGKKALEIFDKESPDLVLLNISLPFEEGYSVIAKIKEHPKNKDIPVMAVTAHAMKGDREDILSAGCDDYIAKPFDPAEILEKIEKLLKSTSTADKGQ